MNAIEAAIEQIQRIISERTSGEEYDLRLPEIRALAQALDLLTTAQLPPKPEAPESDEGFPLVEGFLIHLAHQGRSQRTIAQHKRELELWSVWLMLQGVPIRLATPDLVGRFLVERASYSGGSQDALRRCLGSLQAMYTWAETIGQLPPASNPVREVRATCLPTGALQ